MAFTEPGKITTIQPPFPLSNPLLSIKAYDSACPEKGVLFEVPITVVQPIVVDPKTLEYTASEAISCKPNTILRNFFLVPRYATWAVLEMISADTNDTVGGKFLIHTMQILPMKYCKAQETQKILPVNSVATTVHPFKCVVRKEGGFGI